jgi:hypothetical protein
MPVLDALEKNLAGTRAAIMNNTKTRPDVFGSRLFYPLPGSSKPLPTHPAIVGDSLYRQQHPENPGTKFFRGALMAKRSMMQMPVSKLEEPNGNSPHRY